MIGAPVHLNGWTYFWGVFVRIACHGLHVVASCALAWSIIGAVNHADLTRAKEAVKSAFAHLISINLTDIFNLLSNCIYSMLPLLN